MYIQALVVVVVVVVVVVFVLVCTLDALKSLHSRSKKRFLGLSSITNVPWRSKETFMVTKVQIAKRFHALDARIPIRCIPVLILVVL
jgi:hypothetical protein